MSASTMSPDLAQLREICGQAERLREEVAEAERAASVHWQEACSADEVARDEAWAIAF